jgi:hypothetical protein
MRILQTRQAESKSKWTLIYEDKQTEY